MGLEDRVNTSGREQGREPFDRSPASPPRSPAIGRDVPDSPRLFDWQPLTVRGVSGRLTSISYGWAVAQGWVPAGLTAWQWNNGGYVDLVKRLYYDFSVGDRPGGGGGAAPTYQAPDIDFIRENMKAYVVATTGKAHDDLIEAATNEYLRKDKARWQASEAGAAADIDPFLAAKGIVRNSKQYKFSQDSRPDSVDEMEWVVDRQRLLRDMGLNAQTAEDLGIVAARGSATAEGLAGAANVAQIADSGRLLRQHREELKSKATMAMRSV